MTNRGSYRRGFARALVAVVVSAGILGCGSSDDAAEKPGPWELGEVLPAQDQAQGDPVRGRELLLEGDYLTCGIPQKLYADPTFGAPVKTALGVTDSTPTLTDRGGEDADLPYFVSSFQTPEGVEVVSSNCLFCHGGVIDGQLVIGLGNAAVDFTARDAVPTTPVPDSVLETAGLSPAEIAAFRKISARTALLAPSAVMRTVGNNPAEQVTAVLVMHHDQETLAWSDEPLLDLGPRGYDGTPSADAILTSDAPPWWRVKKKNALFYNGMARGDHRGTMELATSVCVDDLEQAERVDAWFKDIQAFISTLQAPRYPRSIDAELARAGHSVYERDCAGCHGKYAEDPDDDAHDSYPNLLIPLDVVGTDPAVARAAVSQPDLLAWYNGSFYGKVTPIVPDDPFLGYVPPPLDGIWATPPYLHNGSVPSVELVLNSKARPAVWKRVDYDTTHIDEDSLGWPFVALDYPQAEAPADEQKYVYDTSYFSQSNRGHTFGDHLSDGERRAVIEYLKTL
jgi:mono/diheme cytochrome c family protein